MRSSQVVKMMELKVVCGHSTRGHEVTHCKVLLDKLPHSIIMCMTIKATNVFMVIKSSRTIRVTQSCFDITSPPKYMYSVQWNLHKVEYTLTLNSLQLVSVILNLSQSSKHSIEHILGEKLLDMRYKK